MSNSVPRMKLSYIPPEVIDGKLVVRYQSVDVMPGEFGFKKAFKLSSGLFLFQFEGDEGRDSMIASGPWKFAQYLLVFSPRTPDSKIKPRGVSKILVWIRIPFLNLQLWNEEMFSKISSTLRIPLYADGATSDFAGVSYARLYVEIDAKKGMP
ncbi:hypothetical protein LIER_20255 [Lithospermum erythrorhizon]|uniref:DUF4283 domain-containing protein n=1 Tax=Lithospermum erythrorhizon TaxID=34254 RepID=A0AAV3QN24_LITER